MDMRGTSKQTVMRSAQHKLRTALLMLDCRKLLVFSMVKMTKKLHTAPIIMVTKQVDKLKAKAGLEITVALFWETFIAQLTLVNQGIRTRICFLNLFVLL